MATCVELVLISLLVVLIVLIGKDKTKGKPRLPPGPVCLPVIGTLHAFIGRSLRESFHRLHQKYGPVFKYKLLNYNCVGIADFNLIKKALSLEDFSYRPKLSAFKDFRFPNSHDEVRGILFGNGQEWRENRRFSLRTLKDLGMGKTKTAYLVKEEVEKLVKRISMTLEDKNWVNISGLMNIAVINTLWKLITGEKLEQTDPKILKITLALNRTVQQSPLGLWILFPPSRFICPRLSGFHDSKTAHDSILGMARNAIREHIEDGYSEKNDFIQAYLQKTEESQKQKGGLSKTQVVNDWEQSLQVIIMDLFGAGTETTTTTMMFSLLLMAKHPQIQRKVQERLDAMRSEGHYDHINGFDQANCDPYIEAVQQEVLRFSCIAYMGIHHCTKRDVQFEGYVIPKDTIISLHLWEIMRDPTHFPEPDKFKPERFLDEAGNFRSDPWMIPFLSGQRICIGKALAVQEFFIFFTGLLDVFEFVAPKEVMDRPVMMREGIILTCQEYKLKIRRRECFITREE